MCSFMFLWKIYPSIQVLNLLTLVLGNVCHGFLLLGFATFLFFKRIIHLNTPNYSVEIPDKTVCILFVVMIPKILHTESIEIEIHSFRQKIGF